MLVPLMFIILGVNFSNILGCSIIRHFLLQHLEPLFKRAQHLMNQKGNNGHYINRCYDICIHLHNETSMIHKTIQALRCTPQKSSIQNLIILEVGFTFSLVFCCILRKNCSRKVYPQSQARMKMSLNDAQSFPHSTSVQRESYKLRNQF